MSVGTQIVILGCCIVVLVLLLLARRLLQRTAASSEYGINMTTVARTEYVVGAPVAQAVPGAGRAALTPPNIRAAMHYLRTRCPGAAYSVPLGWALGDDHQHHLAFAVWVRSRMPDGTAYHNTNHILVTGTTDSGKDNLIRVGLLSLCSMYAPDQMQLAIIDGKQGVDWSMWATKQHCWAMAQTKEQIKSVMARLDDEIARRGDTLRTHRRLKWDDLPDHIRPPLLAVVFTELNVLTTLVGVKAFDEWFTAFTASARAFGIRIIAQNPSVSGMNTRWRDNFTLYLAARLESNDEPNTGWHANQYRALDVVPPTELPSVSQYPGVFAVRAGETAINIRTPYITDDEYLSMLDTLPERRSSASEREIAPMQPIDRSAPERRSPASERATPALIADVSVPERSERAKGTRYHRKRRGRLNLERSERPNVPNAPYRFGPGEREYIAQQIAETTDTDGVIAKKLGKWGYKGSEYKTFKQKVEWVRANR